MRPEGAHPDTLEPVERASRDELQALQLERLRATLARAYEKVPGTRRAFDAAGAAPGDLADLADLAGFPLTAKDDLRAAYPFGHLAVPRSECVRLHASSGTTGKPTVVGYTAGDIALWTAVIGRSLRAAGAEPGDLLHNAYGYGLFTGGLGFHHGAEAMGMTCVPVSGGMTARQVQLIADFEPDVMTVTPSYSLAIADEFERQGRDAHASSLAVAILGAEPWTEAMRTEIESRLGLHALNHYGLSEITGPGVAHECVETKDGLTIWEDHFYPEIIDPDSGEVLSEGEFGELVITTLTREAMPMVRFRTRDLTRLLPPSARSMRRIDRIRGRSDDMLIVRGVNVFPSQIEEILLADPVLSPHYFLEVDRRERLDTLTVVVEPREGEAGETAADRLVGAIRSRIGISARVRLAGHGTIERSIGKARRIVDTRELG